MNDDECFMSLFSMFLFFVCIFNDYCSYKSNKITFHERYEKNMIIPRLKTRKYLSLIFIILRLCFICWLFVSYKDIFFS